MESLPQPNKEKILNIQQIVQEKQQESTSELVQLVLDGRFSADYFFSKHITSRQEYDSYLHTLKEYDSYTESAKEALQELRHGSYRIESRTIKGYLPRLFRTLTKAIKSIFIEEKVNTTIQETPSLQQQRDQLTDQLENYLPILQELIQTGKHAGSLYTRKDTILTTELDNAQLAYDELTEVRKELAKGYKAVQEQEQAYFESHPQNRKHPNIETLPQRQFHKAKENTLEQLQTITTALDVIDEGITGFAHQRRLTTEYKQRITTISDRLVRLHQGIGQALQRAKLYSPFDDLPEEFFTKTEDVETLIQELYQVEHKTHFTTKKLLKTTAPKLPTPFVPEAQNPDDIFDQLEQHYHQRHRD